MTEVPPLGPYWSRVKPRGPVNPATMRQGSTSEFDNAGYYMQLAIQRHWDRILPQYQHLAEESSVGSPPTIMHDDHRVGFGSIEFAAMASVILPHMDTKRWNWDILEIGGGYGGLARALMLSLHPEIHYTIVDLPEVSEYSRHYLAEFGDRVTFLTPQQFSSDVYLYDCAIQTRGFMEMSEAELQFYFDKIQSTDCLRKGGLFFTINRVEKETCFLDYPFDDRWQVIVADHWQETQKLPMLLLRRTEESRPELAEAIWTLCENYASEDERG